MAKEVYSNPAIAGALAAAQKQEGEEKVDALLACFGSVNSFFSLGVRPLEASPNLSSGLRNRIKKLRTKLRNSVGSGECLAEVPEGTKPDEAALKALLEA